MPRQRRWPWHSARSSRIKYNDQLRGVPYIRIKQFVLSHLDGEKQELTAASMPAFASKLELCTFADRQGIDLAVLLEQLEEEAKRPPLPAGWFEARDFDGLAYYWYEAPDGSMLTQWPRPTVPAMVVHKDAAAADIQQSAKALLQKERARKAAVEDEAATEIQRAAAGYMEHRRRMAWEAAKQHFLQSLIASGSAFQSLVGSACASACQSLAQHVSQASVSVAESASATGKQLARSAKACVPASAEAFATGLDASKPCLTSFAERCVGWYPHRDSTLSLGHLSPCLCSCPALFSLPVCALALLLFSLPSLCSCPALVLSPCSVLLWFCALVLCPTLLSRPAFHSPLNDQRSSPCEHSTGTAVTSAASAVAQRTQSASPTISTAASGLATRFAGYDHPWALTHDYNCPLLWPTLLSVRSPVVGSSPVVGKTRRRSTRQRWPSGPMRRWA